MAKKPVKKSMRRTRKAKSKQRRAVVESSGKASKESRDVLAGVVPEHWRARLTRMTFPKVGFLPEDVKSMVDANATCVAAHVLEHPQLYGLRSVRKTRRGEVAMVPDDWEGVVQHAVRAGFYLAVRLHQRELEVVPDAATVVRSQKSGLTNSLTKRSKQKQERIATARRMEAEGKSVAEMVAYFKQTTGRGSPSTVYAWLNYGK